MDFLCKIVIFWYCSRNFWSCICEIPDADEIINFQHEFDCQCQDSCSLENDKKMFSITFDIDVELCQ